MRMRQKNRLTQRFVTVLCVSFLPLGIVAFLVSCAVVFVSTERIYSSYQKELESVLSPLQENLLSVEHLLDDFVVDHIAELTEETNHKEIENYEMIRELGEIQPTEQTEGVVYLFDRATTSFYIKYNYKAYRYEEMNDFKEKMLSRGLSQGTSREWELFYFNRKCFLMRTYAYEGYYVGYLVDMNSFLENVKLLDELKAEMFYLSDGNKLLLLEQNVCTPVRNTTWEELAEGEKNSRMLFWEGTSIGCQAAVKVPAATFWQSMGKYLAFLFFILILECVFVYLFWRMIHQWVVAPISIINDAMMVFARDGQPHYRITGIDENLSWEFRRMFENFNEMAREIEEGRERENQIYHMTLDNLRLRMNPHMLMNSFNLIYSMAQVQDYRTIQEFSLCLVDYFRYVLKKTDALVKVREEMDFVKSYLDVQKIRFPDRFNCVYTMSKEAENGLIPPLLIENFVENAIKYALVPRRMTEILINIRKENERLYISVTDTGRGIKPEVLSVISGRRIYVDARGREHIGIYHCRQWMEYYYRGQGRIQVTSTYGAGTQVWIEVPYLEKWEDV